MSDKASNVNTKTIAIEKTYRLKTLPSDTSLKTIIELVSMMEIYLHPSNSLDAAKFIEKHSELVEEVEYK